MLNATVNEVFLLDLLMSDGRSDVFPQVRIYDSSGGLVSTVNLTHQVEGLYQAPYTPTSEGFFSLVYEIYSDSGHTTSLGFGKDGDTLDVSSYRTNILRLLGLVHENAVVDLTAYDSDKNLTSARIRVYNNATNAAAALAISPAVYNTGLLFTYSVSASYMNGLMQTYNILRVL
jgi:hypothetical protein